jgi:hypothetical protein
VPVLHWYRAGCGMSSATATIPQARTFAGSPEEIRHVRQFVRPLIEGCPVIDPGAGGQHQQLVSRFEGHLPSAHSPGRSTNEILRAVVLKGDANDQEINWTGNRCVPLRRSSTSPVPRC